MIASYNESVHPKSINSMSLRMSFAIQKDTFRDPPAGGNIKSAKTRANDIMVKQEN